MATKKLPIMNLEWINTSMPSNDELAQFARDTGLLATDSEFLLHGMRRPEIAFRDTYTMIFLQVPAFDKRTRVTSGSGIVFIMTKNRLHTLHYQPIATLEKIRQEFEENPEKHELAGSNGSVNLALHIISSLHESSFRKLQRLAKHIDIAEDAVFFGNERKMVEEVAVLGRDVLDFRRIIRPHLHVFETLPLDADENTIALWRRVGSQMHQMWELLDSLHDSAKELRNTNDSLLQHKENELLRLLSFYSIIAIPIWAFIGPFSPLDSVLSARVYWAGLGLLAFFLLIIFIRARRRKVL